MGLTLHLTPRDPDWWNRGQRVIEDNLHRFDFDEFSDHEPLQYGDVLLFQVGAPTINHTGIYVGNGLVLLGGLGLSVVPGYRLHAGKHSAPHFRAPAPGQGQCIVAGAHGH